MIYIYTNKRKIKTLKNTTPSENPGVNAGVSVTALSLSVKHPHDITISPKRQRLTSGLPDLTFPHSSQTPFC